MYTKIQNALNLHQAIESTQTTHSFDFTLLTFHFHILICFITIQYNTLKLQFDVPLIYIIDIKNNLNFDIDLT